MAAGCSYPAVFTEDCYKNNNQKLCKRAKKAWIIYNISNICYK